MKQSGDFSDNYDPSLINTEIKKKCVRSLYFKLEGEGVWHTVYVFSCYHHDLCLSSKDSLGGGNNPLKIASSWTWSATLKEQSYSLSS